MAKYSSLVKLIALFCICMKKVVNLSVMNSCTHTDVSVPTKPLRSHEYAKGKALSKAAVEEEVCVKSIKRSWAETSD